MPPRKRSYLKRLPKTAYRGRAYIHWTHSIQDRQTGWLDPVSHSSLREILTHTCGRYHVACPTYCFMPDHLHMLWIGLSPLTDQLNANRFFRTHCNRILSTIRNDTIRNGLSLQKQAYDHVLSDEERLESAFYQISAYILENPERSGLVRPGQWASYPYSGCVVAGYPALDPRDADFWSTFWKIELKLKLAERQRVAAMRREENPDEEG